MKNVILMMAFWCNIMLFMGTIITELATLYTIVMVYNICEDVYK